MRLTRGRADSTLPVSVSNGRPRPTECYLCCRLTLLPIFPVAQRDNGARMSDDGSPVDQDTPSPSTLEIAVMVFQLRVVAGTPKIWSNVPR
jgi:hypothetical protein